MITLIRHGETKWTLSGQHTGHTDIELTENGKVQAKQIGKRLHGKLFSHVFVSPLKRAEQTCEHAGLVIHAKIDPDLKEWDYGDFEGLTTLEIQEQIPGWNIFTHGAPRGESIEDVQARADRVLSRLKHLDGEIALMSHGHFLRVLAARWLKLPASEGRLLALYPGSLSQLGFERKTAVLSLWNDISHL
jgi:probable phosphoglycerate mutase